MQRQGSMGGSAAIRIRVTGGVLLVAHLALVAWLTLRPLDVPWVMPANLRPLDGIRADLALGWPQAARELGEGLALLAPLGVLLPMADGRLTVSPLASFVRTAAAGVLISLAIELLQSDVPGRVLDVDSLLLNTVGVALAHLAVVPAARARLRRRTAERYPDASRQEEPSQGRTPTIPRVGIAPWSDALPPSSP
ncbi:VanZ family protein [Streptomyces sp.]|uniref:VanZ family protein n=1 Tax=Streptomyces sp. TaxID=1931 RepID=UPI002D494899|nr:VanZ family protein [Streptomyces sp.]HZF90807.1 VanZ family protein [Streptomyces sp.]